MKKLFVGIIFSLALQQISIAQSSNDFMIGVALDVLKTDFDAVGDKMQLGVELNYFLQKSFSVTGGLEFWSRGSNSVVIGMRWFPVDNAFLRFRGLIGDNDLSLGFGWSKPLNRNWRFEAMGDYYTSGEFAVRGGIGFVIR